MHTNRKYEEAINQFLLQAEEIANGRVNQNYYRNRETWMANWNRCFHDEMNRLAREAGVRSF